LASFTALYDACVLYPAPLRDFLIRLARRGLFRARWSAHIHEEWIASLLKNRPDLTREKVERTKSLMDNSVLDCLVHNYECFIDALELPDAKDRHVLAAAIRGKADVIVTFNLKDFPEEILTDYDLHAQHPDEFISHLIDLDAGKVYEVVKQQRASLRAPSRTVEELLLTFESVGLAQTTAALRTVTELL
jgi:predicted nucleic acid-binding protein